MNAHHAYCGGSAQLGILLNGGGKRKIVFEFDEENVKIAA
jgi:hypothetical protein